ncbi:MAG: rhodanese-like domain-containing protein [Candidatus Acidiferrales bacterium]|jgi:rhodanese-related sulfurtransferase
MRKLMLIVLLATTATLAQQSGTTPRLPKTQVKVLTRAELDDLLTSPSQLLLIDVRRPDEVTSIGGFPVYLSVQIGDLEKKLAWIPKDRSIVTVSNQAHRGAAAADILTKNGFKVVGTIGAETYEKAGGTLTKIVPPPATTAAAGNQNRSPQ